MVSDIADLNDLAVTELVRGVIARDKGAVARALNLVEDRRVESRRKLRVLLEALPEKRARVIGVTGPPGAGKSTLLGALKQRLREREVTTAIVAVDPSSVRSGGALLGDRARMHADPDDDGLFVRSLATGGELGGLSADVPAGVELLGATYDVVLVETTGVGQNEIDVSHVVDLVALVVQPGSGDTLQFLKSGVMEIPDVLIVNKSDQGALATRALADLQGALGQLGVTVPALPTSATTGEGVHELVDLLLTVSPRDDAEGRSVALAWNLFTRRYGSFGVDRLGGKKSVKALLQQWAGVPGRRRAERLSDAFERAWHHESG